MKDTIDQTVTVRGRLAWFVGLWAAGVGTVICVGVILRAWLL